MATVEKVDVHIRWMILEDVPGVLGIEQESFDCPWSEEDFLRCLRQRNCVGRVAEFPEDGPVDPMVVGFFIYELHKTKLHLLSFVVSPDFRWNGIEDQMVANLIVRARRHGEITIELRDAKVLEFLVSKLGNLIPEKGVRCGY